MEEEERQEVEEEEEEGFLSIVSCVAETLKDREKRRRKTFRDGPWKPFPAPWIVFCRLVFTGLIDPWEICGGNYRTE